MGELARRPAPTADVVASALGPSSRHAHLWTLPDGTGIHAPFGGLVQEVGTGRLCCHYCGQWFEFLGAHVRAHGLTAREYRVGLGLRRGQPLMSTRLSAVAATRQSERYRTSAGLRATFAIGQDLARDGTLGHLNAQMRVSDPLPSSSEARRNQALEAGRRSRAVQRLERLEAVVSGAGLPDLPSYLRVRYAAGASLETLARETGLGRSSLRRAVSEAGITPRPRGVTTARGRRSRAETADEQAAKRVGTDDLGGWLVARRREGWTLARLGRAVGHSGHWVRWRLDAQVELPALHGGAASSLHAEDERHQRSQGGSRR